MFRTKIGEKNMLFSLEPAAAGSGASDESLAEGLDFVALCYEFPPWFLAGAIWTGQP